MYLQRTPAAPLSAHVACLWASERGALAHARERILPSGCDNIVIAMHDAPLRRFADEDAARSQPVGLALWQGAHDVAVLRDTSAPASVIGISFRAGGAAAFAGLPMGGLAGRAVALDALWGPAARELRERLQHTPGAAARLALLERWLLKRLERAAPADPVVQQALALFAREPALAQVERVRRATGCSPQRFIARFRDAVGLTPKRYARVLRFHTLVQQLGADRATSLAELALDAGYADQAHLAHEFRRLGGLTPGAYRPVAADRPTHVAIGD